MKSPVEKNKTHLRVAPNASVMPAERNDVFELENVLYVPDGLADRLVLNGVHSLASVLVVRAHVLAAHLARSTGKIKSLRLLLWVGWLCGVSHVDKI